MALAYRIVTSIIPPGVLQELHVQAGASPAGAFVEVGVYRGGSARILHHIAVVQNRALHLFDTFSGMPFSDPGDKHPVGDFSDGIDLAAMRRDMPHAVFHVGVFPDTMPAGLKNIAFAHVDCDQYRSVLNCIDTLWPLIVPDGIMWFDDFGALPGARKAVLDRFEIQDLLPAPEGRAYAIKGRR